MKDKRVLFLVSILLLAFLSGIPGVFSQEYMTSNIFATNTFPENYQILYGSLASGSIPNLNTSDNVYMVFNGNLSVIFNGTITGHLPFLQVTLELKTSTAVTQSIGAYNYTKGSFDGSGSMRITGATSTSDSTKYLYNILLCEQYRNSSTNEWKIQANFTGTAAYTISFDFIQFSATCYLLSGTNSSTAKTNDRDLTGTTVGIRVWTINSTDQEKETSSGSNVAVVNVPDAASGYVSNTWSCPQVTGVNATVVRVYQSSDILRAGDPGAGFLPFVFLYDGIDSNLLTSTWNATYHFTYIAFDETIYFDFGSSTKASRIEGISTGVISENQDVYYTFTESMTLTGSIFLQIEKAVTVVYGVQTRDLAATQKERGFGPVENLATTHIQYLSVETMLSLIESILTTGTQFMQKELMFQELTLEIIENLTLSDLIQIEGIPLSTGIRWLVLGLFAFFACVLVMGLTLADRKKEEQ